MGDLKVGSKFQIHSYKHDGSIHRAWDEAILLEEQEDCLIFGNDRTLVTESDGRTWKTKEPAVLFFYKKRWYNVIGQKKTDGIYYYCNMASPYIIEDNTIKNIDYDLDLRVFSDNTYKILDKSEYKYHKEKMKYTDELDKILTEELKSLISIAKTKKDAFDKDNLEKYYKLYEKLKKRDKKVDKNVGV